MNDIELLGNAILSYEKKSNKYLFEGRKIYNETIDLIDDVTKYKALIFNFSCSNIRQSVNVGPFTENFGVSMVYTPESETSRTVDFIRARVEKISNKRYIIRLVKRVKEKEILINAQELDFGIISILGVL